MAPATELSDDLAEEILLRFPPDNPARLARAALACRRACRLVADPGFRRRFREFHGAPPILGFFRNTTRARFVRRPWSFVMDREQDLEGPLVVARFVPTSSSCLARTDLRDWRVVDARHGRVLLHWGNSRRLAVWDPMTCEKRGLPIMPVSLCPDNWNAAVFCATAGCNHLDCHGNRFTVVFLVIKEMKVFDYVFSTEDVVWSCPPNPGSQRHDGHLPLEPSALVGNALYFVLQPDNRILEYNVGTREMTVIRLPSGFFSEQRIVLMTTEDGGLGVATVRQSKLCLWSREIGSTSEKDAGWAQRRVIDLKTLLPIRSLSTSPVVAGYASGINVIFVRTCDVLFMIDLKSSRVKKVCREVTGASSVFPYMSFYYPVLGGVSTGDGSRGASSARPCHCGLAFGPVAQGGDEDSDIGGCEHSHDHGIDDDDNESEATMSDADDDDDNEAMEGDEDDEDGVEAYLTSLLFLLLAASGGELP